MSEQDDRAAVSEALKTDGVVFPRGVLGREAHALAAALGAEEPGDELQDLVDRAAAVQWPELQAAIRAALERALERAEGERRPALARAVEIAGDPTADNPLARALVVRAGQELSSAQRRASEIVAAAEGPMGAGGPAGMVAGARAAGAAAVELLDLDPEDYGAEISAYVAAVEGSSGEEETDPLSDLARATGDAEVRAAARSAITSLENLSTASKDGLIPVVVGDPPDDPAEDAVWVGAALALAEHAVERALVEESVGQGGNGASAPS